MAKISISRAKFLDTIRLSEAFDMERISQLVDDLGEDADATTITKQLLSAGLLSRWQAKYLLTGRHRLRLGKYVLQDSLARDSLGDRFIAYHSALDRRVQLQILPEELGKHPEKFAKFIEQAQLAADLDHPHLIHVFDIDKEAGRFYLVLEHVEGKIGAQVEIDELTDEQVAALAEQALDGIHAAHQQGIVHGGIGLNTLLLSDKQDLRITDIALSTLRRMLDRGDEELGVSVEVDDDYAAIGSAMVELIKRAKRGAAANQLLQIFTSLTQINTDRKIALDQVREDLKDWIDKHSMSGIDLQAGTPLDSNDPEQATDDSPQPRPEKAKTAAPVVQPRSRFRALMIPVIVLLVVSALAGGFWLSQLLKPDPGQAVMQDGQGEKSNQVSTTDRERNERQNESSATDSNKQQPADANGSSSDDESDKNEASQEQNVDVAEQSSDRETANGNSDAKNDPFHVPGNETNDVETTPTETAESPAVTVESPTPPRPPVFANLRQAIDLPARATEKPDDPILVAQLFPQSGEIHSLEIAAGQKFKRQSEFALRVDDGQAWTVLLIEAEQETEVARFSFRENLLWFEWLEDAAANEDADYLRNVVLRVAAEESLPSRLVSLREPVVLENLAIDDRKFVGEVSHRFVKLPELGKITFESEDVANLSDELFMDGTKEINATDKSNFVRVDFEEMAENRFLWLQVKPEFNRNGQASFRAELRVQPVDENELANYVLKPLQGDRVSKVYRPKLFSDLQQFIGTFQTRLSDELRIRQHAYDTRQVTEGRRDYKTINDKMSACLEQTNASVAALDVQQELVLELVDKAIPFKVYYEIDEQHRIELARSGIAGGDNMAPAIDLNLSDNQSSVSNVLKNSTLDGEDGEISDWEFEFTKGGNNNVRYTLEPSDNLFFMKTYDGVGSVRQSGVNTPNRGAGQGQAAQLAFSVSWNDSSKSNASQLVLSVSGHEVWQLKTTDGDAKEVTSAATGGARLVLGQTIQKDQLTRVMIDLPPSIALVDEIKFAWALGHDDFMIDDVELLVNPKRGHHVEGEIGQPCSLAHIDCSIMDPDSNSLESAKVILVNAQEGDGFLIDGQTVASGDAGSIKGTQIAYSAKLEDGQLILELSGKCPVVQYAYALSALQFHNPVADSSAEDRYFDITVNDGTSESEVASSTVGFSN